MDRRKEFRSLVTNTFMPKFDYIRTKYSFSTVFYKTAYSYCLCACGFEHEYLEYISEKGKINKIMYEAVIDNILRGKCPHVNRVPKEYVKETCIYAIHIAAAVGTEEAVKRYCVNILDPFIRGRLFGLNVFAIAAMKHNYHSLEILDKVVSDVYQLSTVIGDPVLIARRPASNTLKPSKTKISMATLLELCVLENDVRLVETVLKLNSKYPIRLATGLKAALNFCLTDMEECIVDYMCNKGVFENNYDTDCICVLYVYNRPEALDKILRCILRNNCDTSIVSNEINQCLLLSRPACERVLLKYGISDQVEFNTVERADHLVKLLERFFDACRHDVKKIFKTNLSIRDATRRAPELLGCAIQSYMQTKRIHGLHHATVTESRIIETLIDIGIDVNYFNKGGTTPISYLLDQFAECLTPVGEFRASLQRMIFENPDMNYHYSIVDSGIMLDEDLERVKVFDLRTDLVGGHILDAAEHAVFEDSDDYALNFFGPFLINCGFPVSKDTLVDALEKKTLHPEELAYFQSCLDTPRKLIIQCRDVLRSHFHGRAIHRYVKDLNIPQTVKDYILIKYC